MRKRMWATRRRSLRHLCWLSGHAWAEPYEASFGPVGYADEDADARWQQRQCTRCHHVEVLENEAPAAPSLHVNQSL